ncbi:hypothetical protein DL96DRAFT_962088 [Flagelloscypha sp. PMI_526]|nr:hypothetical protein DL96DRAFT_962088 [Flagelloscypha sp. PMI_526]
MTTSQQIPVPSSPSTPLCGICSLSPVKYTCPGCSIRTCSAVCSSSHKVTSKCTGVRNNAAFVPMNQYGLGTMMNDYVFLEEMARNVAVCGADTAKLQGKQHQYAPKNKRDILQTQLAIRNIDMEILPVGMHRRKLNQSVWDFKKQTAFLTIEFKFHRSQNPLQPRSSKELTYTALTHRNNVVQPLISILQTITSELGRRRKDPCPAWTSEIVSDTDNLPHCVMASGLHFQPRLKPRMAYQRLDLSCSLLSLLGGKQFVEFPTIEVWEDFTGLVVDSQGVVAEEAEVSDEPPTKRRRVDPKLSGKSMNLLLSGYGSDGSDEDIPMQDEPPVGISGLAGYADSDEEMMAKASQEPRPQMVEFSDEENSSEDDIDPAILLRLLQEVGSKAVSEDEE